MSAENLIAQTLKSLFSGRFYPVTAPDKVAKPYGTYQKIGGGVENTFDGYTGTCNPRIQIDIWGDDYPTVKDLELQVKTAMKAANTAKTLINTPVSDGTDHFEPETQLYRVILDYSCWINE